MTLEHDYIGLSEVPASKMHDDGDGGTLLGNLKETELRLGLPGSESPERVEKAVLSLGLTKGSSSYTPSGAKRGYYDAINGTGNWVFSTGGNRSDSELGKKGCALFSPRGMGENGGGGVLKDAGLGTKLADADKKKKTHVSSGALAPAPKAQVVGWPPIRSYRKNTMAINLSKNNDEVEEKQGSGCLYVKVSMDGAPYLRKVDLKIHPDYKKLSSALEKMFSCFTIDHCGSHGSAGKDNTRLSDALQGSEYVLTYEDKDGDWMLVGDVPWDMFSETCKRLRIMKGSDAIGLGGLVPRGTDKFNKTVKT